MERVYQQVAPIEGSPTPLAGTIVYVGWGSMGDWPIFVMRTSTGECLTLTREGNRGLYKVGLRVQVHCFQCNGDNEPVVTEIWLEPTSDPTPDRPVGPEGMPEEAKRRQAALASQLPGHDDEELIKLPIEERERILRQASQEMLKDYLHDSSLKDFEAFGPSDLSN